MIDEEVVIGDAGFYAVEWNSSIEDTEFVLSGEEAQD